MTKSAFLHSFCCSAIAMSTVFLRRLPFTVSFLHVLFSCCFLSANQHVCSNCLECPVLVMLSKNTCPAHSTLGASSGLASTSNLSVWHPTDDLSAGPSHSAHNETCHLPAHASSFLVLPTVSHGTLQPVWVFFPFRFHVCIFLMYFSWAFFDHLFLNTVLDDFPIYTALVRRYVVR